MAELEPRVLATLECLSRALARASDPWWIIGSVAVALHLYQENSGGDPGEIADVDVILSRHDLDALYQRLPLKDEREGGKAQFLSERFGRWDEPPLGVEFMAGFTMLEDGEWRPVVPQTRQAIALGGHTLFVPEREEMIALLHRFGRDKDLTRAATL